MQCVIVAKLEAQAQKFNAHVNDHEIESKSHAAAEVGTYYVFTLKRLCLTPPSEYRVRG